MRTLSIITSIAICLMALSCQRVATDTLDLKVPVLAGGVYAGLTPGFETKAASLRDSLEDAGRTLPEKQDLPVGTTLYLMIQVWDAEKGEFVQDKERYPLKSYVVGGGNSLYPCRVDYDGTCLEQTGSPLMLGVGKYKFHAVSPARLIRDTTINGKEYKDVMPIVNGDYVIASDPNWYETAPKEADIVITTGSAVEPVELNPMINQTAEMVFNIKKGKNVTKLEILPEGVDLTGIQDDNSGVAFHWSIGGSELPMKVGDKYHGVKVTDWSETGDGLQGKISILPTDATTNAIFILFNIAVNDVPTQYMASLNQQYYKSSHRYTYDFRVNVEDGIHVATWDNIAIKQEGDFTAPGTIDYSN